ncbi:MAG: hypothetical protein EOO26_04045 [Comamonadaceae bacterium]|nr:MAG: hypothetical protein EOO26_04045 [Comamonadaceae bacterium]
MARYGLFQKTRSGEDHMNPKPVEEALIERALAAIEQLLVLANREPVPFHGPTEMAALPAEAQQALQRAEEQSYRERPAQSALHFCLVSAGALLDVSHTLVNRSAFPSPQEREREWNLLAAHTKVAGRSAYRAALILADPTMSAQVSKGSSAV